MTDTPKDALKQTPLHQRHVDAGARMVDFAGFSMPLQYKGILAEHAAVRESCGVFDVSHMGEADFEGPGALDAVQALVTNDVSKLADGASQYTVVCQSDGGIVDDCIVYRKSADRLRIVINAANIDKDLAHFHAHAGKEHGHDCEIVDRSERTGLLAVQGPNARELVASLCGDSVLGVPRFGMADATMNTEAGEIPVTVARTGYTGEDGFEVFCDAEATGAAWDAVVAKGAEPIGLGARDTLRLEARLHLSGSDMDATTNPYEAGLGWTVKLDKGHDFVGRAALAAAKEQGVSRKLVGFVVQERGIVRPGAEFVDASGQAVGHVTSGGPSPTLGGAIGLGYLAKEHAVIDSEIGVRQRRKTLQVKIVKGPFYKRPNK